MSKSETSIPEDEHLKTQVASELDKAKQLAQSLNFEEVKSGEWFIQLLRKVIRGIFLPSKTNVTGHALLLVTLRADAKIVDLVNFSNGDGFSAPGNVEGLALPGPVRSLHDLLGCIRVAFQAVGSDILGGFKRTGDDVCVAGGSFPGRDECLRIVRRCFAFRPKDHERDNDYCKDG